MMLRTRQMSARGMVPGLIAAGTIALCATLAAPGPSHASMATKTVASQRYRYAVDLPAGCRHLIGPGTVDVVCAPDFNPERSASIASPTALAMEVSAELLTAKAGPASSDLSQGYDEQNFREELPQAVCDEADPSRARIGNVKQSIEQTHVVYTADVVCAEVRFLQIAERRALVKYVIGPDARYRLIARGPIELFEKQKQAVEAFLDSFRVLPTGHQGQ